MSNAAEILQNEANLIQTQINNVDATITSQRRVIALNDSYSKKMSAYTRLVLAIVFALAIAVLLNILKSKFDIIPSAVITFAYIILFSASIVYAMFVAADVESREKTDFDKLDLGPPSGVSKVIQKVKQDDTNLNLLPGFCIGKDCCNIGMAWDNNNNKCLTSCTAGQYVDNDSKECTNCAAGKSTSAGIFATCADCEAGKSSTAGGACTNCPAGKTSIAGGLCTDCPAGKSSVAGGVCTDCEAGKTSVAGGLCV